MSPLKSRSTDSQNWLLRFWRWFGLADKTPWDFLQLLILPALFVVLGYFLNDAADERQRNDVRTRFQQGVIKDYYDVITTLVLEKNLAESKAGQSLSDVAKAYTFNVLEIVDGPQKRGIIQFLYGLDLIKANNPIIPFEVGSTPAADGIKTANLAGADLSGMYLWGVRFAYANLQGANLQFSTLYSAELTFADLRDANLKNAVLCETLLKGSNLSNADLTGSNLIDANLERSLLSGTIINNTLYSKKTVWPEGYEPKSYGAICICPNENLQNALLTNRFLRSVDLSNADLTGADLKSAQLLSAKLNNANLRGTNLQNAYLDNSDFSGAQLGDANLRGASTIGAIFDNTVFCKTIMPNGEINNADCP